MKTILYFDLLSGASGDMILSSLVDLGVPVRYLSKELGRLGISGFSLSAKRVKRSGIMGVQMRMKWNSPREYRHLDDILRIIKKGKFNEKVYAGCVAVLNRLAGAEAKVHGIAKSQVHFHEIGAIDTIVDIAGTCLALDYLAIDEIFFSSLTEGYGTITAQHGILPVPAPATAALIQGFHVTRLPVGTELLTPTGAALLTTLGRQSLVCPQGVVKGNGNGCGSKVFETHPNFLRATLVASEQEMFQQEQVYVLETDMDHVSGEIMGNVAGMLMESGALDVSWTPVFMKKGRPGYRLTVIASKDKACGLADGIITQTWTLGVRVHAVSRVVAGRAEARETFMGRTVREKRCSYKGRGFVKPEYDDMAALSREKNLPLIELMERYVRKTPGRAATKTRSKGDV
ncbi:MAG: nickel pincer cofactor biosynthesis protein LarC [Chitinispirillaceae bacterium]|nr:nickel pincer cofactor biosynthesis protein LarC [Chitinispirillaceae bacterium]